MARSYSKKYEYQLLLTTGFSYLLTSCLCELNMATNQTLYDYYTKPNINSGLSDSSATFKLNNKDIVIYSGAVHYFRVPQEYWQDRLRKLRAVGLNAVETYIPWNLHEPQPGYYDFGNGGTDFEKFLDLKKYVSLAQEEDLFVIIRPGPYICSEWDFGGMPSWLLRDENMKIRTSDPKFIKYVRNYFKILFEILEPLQFTKGGPVIAFQIENEYGNVKKDNETIDAAYLNTLKDIFVENGVVEMLFTSDTPSNGNFGSIPGVLYTANFQNDANKELDLLQKYQPGKPSMVMEYWSGWFDHWTEVHHTRKNSEFAQVLEDILKYPSSVNFYMFHGGTNWGFLNGANIVECGKKNCGYMPDTSSYDYDAPLTENGDYTDKYYAVQKLIDAYNKIKTALPQLPPSTKVVEYATITISSQLSFEQVIEQSENVIESDLLLPMEALPINNNTGQSFGYIVYRKRNINIPKNSLLKIEGYVCDTIMVLINGKLMSKMLNNAADFNEFGYWRLKDSTLDLGETNYDNATLELIIENWGRNNFGKLDQFNQKKGLWQGDVILNNTPLRGWDIIPLEFKKNWTNRLHGWQQVASRIGPSLFKAVLDITEPNDTFIDMQAWKKGIVIINGFVLSRYLFLGPQQTAYLPAPLLKKGKNDLIIFEHFQADDYIKFSNKPIYFTP